MVYAILSTDLDFVQDMTEAGSRLAVSADITRGRTRFSVASLHVQMAMEWCLSFVDCLPAIDGKNPLHAALADRMTA